MLEIVTCDGNVVCERPETSPVLVEHLKQNKKQDTVRFDMSDSDAEAVRAVVDYMNGLTSRFEHADVGLACGAYQIAETLQESGVKEVCLREMVRGFRGMSLEAVRTFLRVPATEEKPLEEAVFENRSWIYDATQFQ